MFLVALTYTSTEEQSSFEGVDPPYQKEEFTYQSEYMYRLLPDEFPSLCLPISPTSVKEKQRKAPKERPCVEWLRDDFSDSSDNIAVRDAST